MPKKRQKLDDEEDDTSITTTVAIEKKGEEKRMLVKTLEFGGSGSVEITPFKLTWKLDRAGEKIKSELKHDVLSLSRGGGVSIGQT